MADILVAHPESQSGLYTCLSCTIAFHTAQDQREHYRSDHHRYNMKRRVAGLPPVSATVFNQKVLERRAETAIMASPKGSTCEICGKSYTTENAYRTHLSSKKHKDNELRAAAKAQARAATPESTEASEAAAAILADASSAEAGPSTQPALAAIAEDGPSVEQVASQLKSVALQVDEDATEEQINQTIDEKIAAARARISPAQCLFCNTSSATLDENLTHMSVAHSFFIPDAEYLVDLVGLITYLGEKIAVGNTCIFCSGRGREFRTLEAVRKHMLDKGHCKIAYDTEEDRLEISDFYDFSASYPDAEERKARKAAREAKKAAKAAAKAEKGEDEEWEDLSEDEVDDSEVDEVVEEEASDDDSDDEDEDDLLDNQITYGDSHYELVLPSGARIGHRSMRRYYAQSFPAAPRGGKPEDPNSGSALVRRLLADKNSALVPRKGGFGAYGSGYDVVKARNPGEAREAGRHVREFRDQRRREEFKTKVGFRHNNQKHFRDPLLQ
ncbi:C2H2 type zinc-finger-domain-containing protein [Cubamyces lactineus]|nr:C2H2 type zinc-finger-domain-containing protein [Cubamyces lactineus]